MRPQGIPVATAFRFVEKTFRLELQWSGRQAPPWPPLADSWKSCFPVEFAAVGPQCACVATVFRVVDNILSGSIHSSVAAGRPHGHKLQILG